MQTFARVLSLLAAGITLSSCADGTNPFARPGPQRVAYAPARPAVQYSTNVHNAQKRLQRLGYYHGQLDGLWGPETRAAVERFQRNKGILATAQLDRRTIDALNDTPVAAADTRPSPRLVVSDPTDVRAIQARLRQLGFYDGPADGIWGADTQTAVERFQRAREMPVGEMTESTIVAMNLDLDDFVPQTAFGEVRGDPLSPEVVRAMQRRLREMGFYFGPVDGEWGPATHAALKQFQRSRGIDDTGDLTPATASVMGLDPNDLRESASRQ